MKMFTENKNVIAKLHVQTQHMLCMERQTLYVRELRTPFVNIRKQYAVFYIADHWFLS